MICKKGKDLSTDTCVLLNSQQFICFFSFYFPGKKAQKAPGKELKIAFTHIHFHQGVYSWLSHTAADEQRKIQSVSVLEKNGYFLFTSRGSPMQKWKESSQFGLQQIVFHLFIYSFQGW